MNNFYVNEETFKNIAKLDQTCDINLLDELIVLFNEETPKRIKEIKKATFELNFVELTKAAQSLKSGSAYLGAEQLALLGNEIESSATNNEIPRNMETLVGDLEHFYSLAKEFFNNKKAA